jgi:hypothetical protein
MDQHTEQDLGGQSKMEEALCSDPLQSKCLKEEEETNERGLTLPASVLFLRLFWEHISNQCLLLHDDAHR